MRRNLDAIRHLIFLIQLSYSQEMRKKKKIGQKVTVGAKIDRNSNFCLFVFVLLLESPLSNLTFQKRIPSGGLVREGQK